MPRRQTRRRRPRTTTITSPTLTAWRAALEASTPTSLPSCWPSTSSELCGAGAGREGSQLGRDPSSGCSVMAHPRSRFARPLCREEIGVAWAAHTNLGDYTTAALVWLERCGRGEHGLGRRDTQLLALPPVHCTTFHAQANADALPPCPAANFPSLVERLVPADPASLSPVRKLPGGEVVATWRACSGSPRASRSSSATRSEAPSTAAKLSSTSGDSGRAARWGLHWQQLGRQRYCSFEAIPLLPVFDKVKGPNPTLLCSCIFSQLAPHFIAAIPPSSEPLCPPLCPTTRSLPRQRLDPPTLPS